MQLLFSLHTGTREKASDVLQNRAARVGRRGPAIGCEQPSAGYKDVHTMLDCSRSGMRCPCTERRGAAATHLQLFLPVRHVCSTSSRVQGGTEEILDQYKLPGRAASGLLFRQARHCACPQSTLVITPHKTLPFQLACMDTTISGCCRIGGVACEACMTVVAPTQAPDERHDEDESRRHAH